MAAVKIPHGRVWKNGEAILLLQKWRDIKTNKQTRLLSCPRRKSIWQEISVFLRAMLYENRCEDGCKTKNTYFSRRLYRAYKNKCGKTGKGTSKKKPAYGGLRRSRRPSSHQESPAASQRLLSILPKLALQTVQESKEESKGNVENVVSHLSSNSTGNNKKATKCLEPKRGFSCNMYNELSKKKNTHIAVFFLVYFAD